MTLTKRQLENLMADYMTTISRAKQLGLKDKIKEYEDQLRFLEMAYADRRWLTG